MHFCGVENINGGNDHFKENFTQRFNDYYNHLLFYHIAKGVYFFFETWNIATSQENFENGKRVYFLFLYHYLILKGSKPSI